MSRLSQSTSAYIVSSRSAWRSKLKMEELSVGEKSDAEFIQAPAQKIASPFLNLAGQASLPVLAAVLEKVSIFITTDSGPGILPTPSTLFE
jgi:hypothetical protein